MYFCVYCTYINLLYFDITSMENMKYDVPIIYQCSRKIDHYNLSLKNILMIRSIIYTSSNKILKKNPS